MKDLKYFQTEKDRLLKAYERVVQLKLIPFEELTSEAIDELKAGLQSERFVVSVCGQMKSGKSTLLNALVYGEPVLPADDTVMTAKITLLKFRSEPGFDATFYDQKEWKQLLKEYRKDEEFWQAFQEDLQTCLRQGMYPDQFVSPDAKIEKESDLGNLHRYVALPEKGGVLTPFVKEVCVYHHNAKLRDVTIVDTPGTNDPAAVREKITKSWIHNANAVVYATYAGQALSTPDIEFIDKYLMHVPRSQFVIAVNKIDCVNNMDEVIEHVDGLRQYGDARIRGIFGDEKSVVYACSLAALLGHMSDNNIPIADQQLQEERERLDDQGFLEPDQHRFADLVSVMENRLITNKGEKVLESHRGFVRRLFTRHIQALDRDIEAKNEKLSLLMTDDEQLEAEQKRLTAESAELSQLFKEFEKDLQQALEEQKVPIKSAVDRTSRAVVDNSLRNIARIKNTAHFKNEVCWLVKNSIEDSQESLLRTAQDAKREISAILEDQIATLKKTLGNRGLVSMGVLSTVFNISLYNILGDVEQKLFATLTTESIASLVKEHTIFLQRWFNTEGGRKNVLSALTDELNRYAKRTFSQGLTEKTLHAIEEKAAGVRSSLQYEINAAIEEKQSEIDDILAKRDTRNAQRATTQHEIEELKSRLNALTKEQQKLP